MDQSVEAMGHGGTEGENSPLLRKITGRRQRRGEKSGCIVLGACGQGVSVCAGGASAGASAPGGNWGGPDHSDQPPAGLSPLDMSRNRRVYESES